MGERPLINCLLDERNCQVLWGTGSMISLVDELFLKQHFPNKVIYSVDDFISENLNLKAANNTDVPVKGVVIMNFCVESCEFVVPFLATLEVLANPVLGFNIIAYMISNTNHVSPMLASMLTIPHMNAETMVNLIEAGGETLDVLNEVKLWKPRNNPGTHSRNHEIKNQDIIRREREVRIVYPTGR